MSSQIVQFFCFHSIIDNVTSFIRRMVDPDVGSGATDVYGIMFGCQFIIFLIILFSWSAFAEAEVRGVVYEFESDVKPKQ